ncbi:MAG: BMP family ABC transporter substrate-binding protein [Lachnospira sp.]|nr:BMP family ABC transporter substrate-binding protein [Lachnospira sp.]
MNDKKFQRLLIILGILVAVIIAVIIVTFGYKKDTKTKIGLIITGSIDDDGWNGVHYEGVKNACKDLDAKLLVKENVKEDKESCEKAINDLIKEGATMIILSSYEYPKLAKDAVQKNPDIAFYGISAEVYTKNMTSYFGRMYQARYLAGVLAGLKTENGNVGYVAAMPNVEVNRGINAFTLGVKSVNPDASVNVIWTGTWDDKDKEIKATKDLVNNKNVDVITCHQNQQNVVNEADRLGIYSIGYNEETKGLSDKYLTASVWDWENLYNQIIREFMQGKGNTVQRHWFGIETGVIKLSPYSAKVTDAEKAQIEQIKAEMLAGKNVFSGIIYDTEGKMRCNEGESISDEILLGKLDWYVDGVVMYEE